MTRISAFRRSGSGLKLHVVYDPAADHPRRLAFTPSTVNDVTAGQQVPIEAGATYVFDKAYCSYAWWTRPHDAGTCFVTRQKTNARFRAVRWWSLRKRNGDAFTVIDDAQVQLVSKGGSKLAIPMRRIRLRRDDGAKLILITNDLKRSAVEIAALYKTRWQIEAMFRWIKQHLTLRKFLGRSENAVRLQILAAMIGTAHAHVRREDLAEVADFSLPAGIRNCDGIPQLRNIDSDKWFPMIRQRLVLL